MSDHAAALALDPPRLRHDAITATALAQAQAQARRPEQSSMPGVSDAWARLLEPLTSSATE